MVEKMLFFAKICAEVLDKAANEMAAGLPIWAQDRCDMLSGATLRLKGNSYVLMKRLINKTELEELQKEVFSDERDLMDYYLDWIDEEYFAGVIVGNDLLYEVLYYRETLWTSTQVNEREVTKKICEQIDKIVTAFDLELSFQDARIYIKREKRFQDADTFICKSMQEVEARYQLQQGTSPDEARERSGLGKEEFKNFRKRLEEHELNQTSGAL